MMDFTEYLIKVFFSLLVVLVLLVLLLPYVLRRFAGLRGFGGKGSFEIKKVSPITKNVFIVELEIKGKTYVLAVGEKGAEVIYREDDKGSDTSPDIRSDGSGSGEGNPSDRAENR